MVLDLTTPAGSNFIKDWSAQNAINCDAIDSYAGACLVAQPLGSYVPQLKGSTTNPTLGTGGFIQGYYFRIFDQIYTYGQFRFGTAATNAGSGNYSVTLPFTADSASGTNGVFGRGAMVGSALIWDDSNVAGTHPATVQLISTTEIQFNIDRDSGFGSSITGAAIPTGWTINDGMLWYAKYKRTP